MDVSFEAAESSSAGCDDKETESDRSIQTMLPELRGLFSAQFEKTRQVSCSKSRVT
jgi:hypothetical protein